MKFKLAVTAALLFCGLPGSVSRTDQQTCVCEFVAPLYPPMARLSRTQGIVRLKVSVDAEGIPSDVQLINEQITPFRDGLLATSAMRAVRKWRFCASGGQAERAVVVTFKFKINVDPTVRYSDEWSATEVTLEPPATVEVTTGATTIRAD